MAKRTELHTMLSAKREVKSYVSFFLQIAAEIRCPC